jgi:hypothetical protein
LNKNYCTKKKALFCGVNPVPDEPMNCGCAPISTGSESVNRQVRQFKAADAHHGHKLTG